MGYRPDTRLLRPFLHYCRCSKALPSITRHFWTCLGRLPCFFQGSLGLPFIFSCSNNLGSCDRCATLTSSQSSPSSLQFPSLLTRTPPSPGNLRRVRSISLLSVSFSSSADFWSQEVIIPCSEPCSHLDCVNTNVPDSYIEEKSVCCASVRAKEPQPFNCCPHVPPPACPGETLRVPVCCTTDGTYTEKVDLQPISVEQEPNHDEKSPGSRRRFRTVANIRNARHFLLLSRFLALLSAPLRCLVFF